MKRSPHAIQGMPTVRAVAAADIADLLTEKGINPRQVFEKAGLDINLINDAYQQIRLDHFTYLFELAAEASQSPDFGLSNGVRQNPQQWGAFGYLVLNSPTVGAALNNLATFFKPWQSGTHIAYVTHKSSNRDSNKNPNDKTFGLEYSITHPLVIHKNQDAESAIGYAKHLVDILCQQRIRPAAVQFEHKPLFALSQYKKVFGVTPRFQQKVNSITFPCSFENKTVAAADLQLFPVLQQHMVDMVAAIPVCNDLITNVNHHIQQLLPLHQCNLKNTAKAMALEARTLQRKLKEEGQVFSLLLENIRLQQAKHLLQHSQLALKEISYLLGFRHLSGFNKAFKQWTGLSPGQYRGQN